MRDRSCVAVGWSKVGDISWLDGKQDSRRKLKELLEKLHPNHPSTIGRDCSQLSQFAVNIAEGDIVLAANGMLILGIGRVVGGYEFHSEFEFPHQRQVEWLILDNWQMPESGEGLQSTVREIGKFNENILEIERRIQSPTMVKPVSEESPPRTKRIVRLSGIPGRIQSILDRKGQVILFGPPGTGKTFWAERTANDLAALSRFGR